MAKKIKTTMAVMKEVAAEIMTGICGHAPDPLSEPAKRLYKAWEKRKFDASVIEIIDMPKK